MTQLHFPIGVEKTYVPTGPPIPYGIAIPYSTTSLDGKVREHIANKDVEASSFEEAVDKACAGVEESMFSARIRKDILSWNTYPERAQQIPLKNCA